MMNDAPFPRDDYAVRAIPVLHKEARQSYHPIHLRKHPVETDLSTNASQQTPLSASSAWEELTRLVTPSSCAPQPPGSSPSTGPRSFTAQGPLEQKTSPGGKGSTPTSNPLSEVCQHCPVAVLPSFGPPFSQRYHIHKYSDILVLTDPYVALHSAILHHREYFGCTPTHIVVPRKAYELMADRHRRQMGVELRHRYPFFNGTGLDYVTLHPSEIDLPGRPSSLPPWLQPSASQLGLRLLPDTLFTISQVAPSELALMLPVPPQPSESGGHA